MKIKQIIIKIGVFLFFALLSFLTNTPIYFYGIIAFEASKIFLKEYKRSQQGKKDKQNELTEFHAYLKSVILLTYTRPLKIAFKDANKTKNKVLKTKIDEFIEDIKYDFSIDSYKKLALKINSETNGINYELNIMYLLYEFEKKGLGSIFINDILNEIDSLIDNVIELKIETLRENAYIYTLPPTVLNFFYVTIILFEVIDKMIMGVMS